MRVLDGAIAGVMAGHDRYLIEGRFWGGSDQEIIAYGRHTQRNRSGKTVEWHIAGLALQKNYLSVYINALEDDQYLVERYAHTLGKVRTGKSSVSFRELDDIDLDALLSLIARARDILSLPPASS
jgi:hypothetical protein